MKRIQDRTNTGPLRENSLLRSARSRLTETSPNRKLRVLSFGCSVGDEVANLKALFPEADIYGCDIDEPSLAVAKRTTGHFADIFLSTKEGLSERGPFDLIVAFSVLCLNPSSGIQTRFPVSVFDEMVGLLDEVLLPGGILAIKNSSYRFRDSPYFESYDPVRCDGIWFSSFIDVFARDGRFFLKQVPLQSLFTQAPGAAFSVQDDEELTEVLFEKRFPGHSPAVHTMRLAPMPDTFVVTSEYTRSNLDNYAPERPRAIEVFYHYRFGTDTATGQAGYGLQISWKSRVHDGMHVRPEIWFPNSL